MEKGGGPSGLRHMQKSCRPNVSPCGETTFDLGSNFLGRRGKLVPCDQFYSLLRVVVRRGLEFSGTHQHHSKLRRMEAKFWIGACFWHECQVSLRSLGIQHTVQTTPSSNCSSLSVLFERLRLSQGSE